jgi:competence protein ComEC
MKRPLLSPLVGLMLGIALSGWVRCSLFPTLIIAFLGIFLLFAALLRHSSIITYLASLVLFIAVGWVSGSYSLGKVKNESNLLNWANGEKSYLIGRIDSPCEADEKGLRLNFHALTLKQSVNTVPVSGHLFLKIGNNKEQAECPFQEGDIVQTYTLLKQPDRFKNRFSFDYPFFLLTRGITATAYVESELSVVKIGEETSSFTRGLNSLRSRVKKSLEFLPNIEDRKILSALLLGDKKGISQETEKLFRHTGTTHLLVVSGLHLAMIGGIFYGLIRLLLSLYPPLLLKISAKKTAFLLSILPVIAYAALVGFSPSVLRAVLAGATLGLLLFLSRERDPLGLLTFIAFVLLLIEPLSLFDLSFQLSFLSVFSMILLVPRWEKLLEARFENIFSYPLVRRCLQILLASLAVQVGLFPILVNRFHQISLVSLPANLVLVPVFSVLLMPLGLLGMLFSWIWPPLASFFFSLTAYGLKPLLFFLKFLAALPGSAPHLAGFGWIQNLFFYLTIALCLIPMQRKLKIPSLAFLILANLMGVLWYPVKDHFDSSLRVNFLDVGQGDSTLIELPYGKKILVDGGGLVNSSFDIGEQVLAPSLFSRGIWKIDTVVLTHPHPDHYGGLKAVLETFHPREVWWNGENINEPSFQDFLAEINRLKIPLKRFDASTPSFNRQGVHFEVLYPQTTPFSTLRPDSATINNHSLVLRLEYRGLSLLLAGDIQEETEHSLTQANKILPAMILKIPHHGSDTSSTEEWVRAVNPQVGLIGVGRENRFHFPKPVVVSRYESIGTSLFRTDLDGETDLTWDGKKLKASTFTGKRRDWVLASPNLEHASLKAVCEGSSCGF